MYIYSRWLDSLAVILAAGLTVILVTLIESAPW
jgi:hypothetical protein